MAHTRVAAVQGFLEKKVNILVGHYQDYQNAQ